MNILCLKFSPIALAVGLFCISSQSWVSAQTADSATPPPVPAAELPTGSELLTQGPVHEAFAKPVSTDPQAPVVIPQTPPADLQEMPPAEQPVGANIVWVPGYWAWDDQRNDFIWVSGCWRNAPPNTSWIPGHWLQLDNGWEWIAGFWKPLADQGQQTIEYLPAPPAAFEVEAVGTPPSPDQIWVPGCWYYSNGQYVQRHGYWMAAQSGWVWVPSHYAWTPRGCIFAAGHWDYDLDNRGVLFSPVFFPSNVRAQAGFVFSPGLCVDLGMLRLNLFVNPRYNHYYFGDYYDASYQRAGIYPWYQCQTLHSWYDPLYVYDKWQYGRTDPNWAKNQVQHFKQLQSNRALRPAHTYTEWRAQYNRLPANQRPERPLFEPMKTYAAAQSTPMKFERLSTAERQQFTARNAQVRDLRKQLTNWEAPAKTTASSRRENSITEPTDLGNRETSTHPADRQPSSKGRVTTPEQEVLKGPAFAPKPSESRYIEKTSPAQPRSENSYRPGTGDNGKNPDKDAKQNWQK